jgi:hypothetical protein
VLILAAIVLVIILTAASGAFTVAVGETGVQGNDIRIFAERAGFSGSDLDTAVAIAMAESSGNPVAVGDIKLAPERGPSIGLWQINIGSKAHPEYDRNMLMDPQYNANAAYKIYEAAGYSFHPWSTGPASTGGNDAYLAYLPQGSGEVGV